MSPSQNYIRQRVLQMANATGPVAVRPAAPKKGASAGLTYILGFCILVLSLATFWVMSKKSSRATAESHHKVTPEVSPIERPAEKEGRDELAELNKRLESIEGKFEGINNRIWLLAVSQNENTHLALKSYRQMFGQCVADPGFVLFEGDWTLNRMPQHLSMTDDQRKKLEGCVKGGFR